MVVFLLVELLGEEGQDVHVRALLDLNDDVEGFLDVETAHGDFD